MNKAAIQRFAIWARTELIAQVSQRAYQYGITADGYGETDAVTVRGRALNTDEQRQRGELVEQIRQKGYTQVMEEVAYTWFNRFIALRFMEVNNYLPSHIRIFSDSAGAFKPEILNDVLHLDLPGLNSDKVAAFIEKNQTEDLYRYLLLTQCNALNEALPRMFEQMGGYTELLLPNNILKQDSVLGHMVMDIPEEDWTDQVQVIGWLYQYYNTELKDDTFALLKKNVKITKERIPSATQLFTPDWIVRYMVENSLGRIWLEGHPDDELKAEWKYYLDEAPQEADVQAQLEAICAEYRTLKPQDIKVIDPCMGSGHILIYAFDVLVQIYRRYGISERDAAQSILENNLYGLDIDDRAAQLAYFAVMMKARQYDRRIFSCGIQPQVYSIVESNALSGSYKLAMGDFLLSKGHQETLNYLLEAFIDAKEYGSILQLEDRDYKGLMEAWNYTASQTAGNFNLTLWFAAVEHEIPKLIEQAIMLTQKYDVVVTNPPYMGSSGMGIKLSDYVKMHYPDSKSDLFAAFIERCGEMAAKKRYQAMITQHAWMFLSSFEKLRTKLLMTDTINMAHLGARAFEDIDGEVVQTTSFVLRKSHIADFKGTYCRLIEPTTQQGKEEMFLEGENRYTAQQSNFSKIPGSPIAYWVSSTLAMTFEQCRPLGELYDARSGLQTNDNNRFLRFWFEINLKKIGFNCEKMSRKWFPHLKGGPYRRWYGNQEYVVNWENGGQEILEMAAKMYGSPTRTAKSIDKYFLSGLTWSDISTGLFAVRKTFSGYIFDTTAPTISSKDRNEVPNEILGYLNSKVVQMMLKLLAPTIHYNCGSVALLPYKIIEHSMVSDMVNHCITISKVDWDAFEASWDFKQHPLVAYRYSVSKVNVPDSWYLKNTFEAWEYQCQLRFDTLKSNEEELNRIFIDIYGLQDELTPEVQDKDVTVRKAGLGRDIRSLISYAVGCMFGRYSLDVDGLAYAGGEWDDSRYSTFIPDKDNIIPICDDDYFDDDITGRFVKWVETVYGSETLEENLKFIADALGGKGTPREVIRSYFINGFYADHLKIYQKRPIYWLFDSGKKNGFKALIYMHRYQSDLLARMRTDYVHEQQERYRTQLVHIADTLEHASGSERVKLTKQQQKIQEQALEIQKYEEKVHHLADQNIEIDLDDGVKHNYALFADVLAKIK